MKRYDRRHKHQVILLAIILIAALTGWLLRGPVGTAVAGVMSFLRLAERIEIVSACYRIGTGCYFVGGALVIGWVAAWCVHHQLRRGIRYALAHARLEKGIRRALLEAGYGVAAGNQYYRLPRIKIRFDDKGLTYGVVKVQNHIKSDASLSTVNLSSALGVYVVDAQYISDSNNYYCYEISDGRIDQPVPWDERCLMNFTTSLCNADAIESCRYYVGDMREDPILACYVITDGVEDAFDDQSGVNAFMGKVTGWLAGRGARGLEEYLGEFLPDFSRTGSADDVSVAGIADAAAAAPFAERFFIGAERFELLGRLNAARSKLNSMQRKTDYLRARYEQAQESFAASERRLDEAKAEYDEWMDQRRVYEDSVEAAQKELAALDERLAGLDSGK